MTQRVEYKSQRIILLHSDLFVANDIIVPLVSFIAPNIYSSSAATISDIFNSTSYRALNSCSLLLEGRSFSMVYIFSLFGTSKNIWGHSPRLVQGLNEEVFKLFLNVPTSKAVSTWKQEKHDHMIVLVEHPVCTKVKLRQVDCKLRAFRICTFLFHSQVPNDKRINIKV